MKKDQPKIPARVFDGSSQATGYADLVEIKVTAEEAVFHFGLRKESNPNEAVGIAKMYVSVAHAKRIARILTNSLKEYEHMFGEIKTDVKDRLTPEGQKWLEELLPNEQDN
jgi:hypothetical protein